MGDVMAEFLQLFINGLAVGCIYGLVALGFVLIYKAGEAVNFAQGERSLRLRWLSRSA